MDSYVDVFLAGLSGTVILLLLLVIILMVRISRINKRYRKLIGNSNVENVDDLLMDLQEGKKMLESTVKEQADAIDGIRKIMRKMKSNVSVHRYNAFAQQGSDLSFSIAILDDEQDGVVLTGRNRISTLNRLIKADPLMHCPRRRKRL
jgi:hypothetical protein